MGGIKQIIKQKRQENLIIPIVVLKFNFYIIIQSAFLVKFKLNTSKVHVERNMNGSSDKIFQ